MRFPGHSGLALCLLLAAGLAARAGWVEDRPGGTTVHVSLFSVPDPTRTDPTSRGDVAVMKEFLRRFPRIFAARYRAKYAADPGRYGEHDWSDVDLRLHGFSGIQVEGVESDLLAIAGRVAPDVLYVNFRKSDTYIQQRFLYPLDKPEDGYLSAMSAEEMAFRVHPKIRPVIERQGPDGDRHVWVLPYGGALGRILLYRKDLFDAAEVAYPDADWTWDDLLDAARRLTDPERGIYGLRLGHGKDESWFWVPFLWSTGAEIEVYDEAAGRWTIGFDAPEAAHALDFYTRICTEPWTDARGRQRYGYAYKDSSDAYIRWERGDLAMAMSYIEENMFSSINPDVTGMAPIPKGPTGIRAAELNCRMMGLFSEIADPVVRDMAWEYMRFYDCPEAAAIRTRILVESGLGHFVNPDYLERFGYPEMIRLSPRGWAETFRIAIETGRPEPYGRNSAAIYDILTIPLNRAEELALAGKLPAEPEARLAVMRGLLRDAADKARQEMLGELPSAERRRQRITGGLFVVTLGAGLALMFRRVARAFTGRGGGGVAGARRRPIRRHAIVGLLLLPAVLTILVWQYLPLLRGSIMAFQDYRILGGSAWAGVDNFGAVLWDRAWWTSVWNGIRYSFLVMALTFLPPIVLAILLQEIPRGKILFRTIYYLPAVVTGLVVILLWKSFYDESDAGVLNALLMRVPAIGFLGTGAALFAVCAAFARRMRFHQHPLAAAGFLLAGGILFAACAGLAGPILRLEGVGWPRRLLMTLPTPYRWLGDPDTAMIACVIPMVWAGMGPGCLIYLAALKGISDEYYEAADIDGATFIDKIFFIVLPILKPLILINFIGVFVGSWFGATANILAMTGGGAGTEVAGLHIFYKAFVFVKFGPATAMAWVLGFILIGFTVHQLRILSRLEFRTAEP